MRLLRRYACLWAVCLVWPAALLAQASPTWQQTGSAALHGEAAGLATGRVERVWYAADGRTLFARTERGLVYQTTDYETWQSSAATPPERGSDATVPRLPMDAARAVAHPVFASRLYALGAQLHTSTDGGRSWLALTADRQGSLLGGTLLDMTASPNRPEELVACGDTGVWRSLDEGASWSSLNAALPNLPVVELRSAPEGTRGARIVVRSVEQPSQMQEAEWMPGEAEAWRVLPGDAEAEQQEVRQRWGRVLGMALPVVRSVGTTLYAGSLAGQLWSSVDAGRTWQGQEGVPGFSVETIAVDAQAPAYAVALLRATSGSQARLLLTRTSGASWESVATGTLPGRLHSVSLHAASSSLYAGTSSGLFYAPDVGNPVWQPLAGLPTDEVVSVLLSRSGHRLYAAVAGHGVYSTLAPHRHRQPAVVSAADGQTHAAAPGALVSVLGGTVQRITANGEAMAVLDAASDATQVQVPYTATGDWLALAWQAPQGAQQQRLPLRGAAPVLVTAPDGNPLLLDADSGTFLSATAPARRGMRVQLLATGLGAVQPAWTAGVPAPLANPPRVRAAVQAFLNGRSIPVSQATLAPGYTGFYLVEAVLPLEADLGAATLSIECEGMASNAVLVYLTE